MYITDCIVFTRETCQQRAGSKSSEFPKGSDKEITAISNTK